MDSWRSLNERLHRLTEKEVWELLQAECKSAKRVTVIERLHQRYCTLRATRERLELLQEVGHERKNVEKSA